MCKCFAEDVNGKCGILYVSKCNKESCRFYKTKDKADSDLENANSRCKKLGVPSGTDYVIWKKAKDSIKVSIMP